MYEELVKRLIKCEQFKCNECDYEKILGCRTKLTIEAVNAIENLDYITETYAETVNELKEQNRWIPVTERLPVAERKHYWVCTDTGYQCECRWTKNRFGIGESDEWGWSIFDIPQYQKVVAWMSLPDPYEPPKEET